MKQETGRPKTDKLDAVWLAKLNERGLLRPSFVPRHKQRLGKLVEDALIKLSSVVLDLGGESSRAIIEALIAGQRDPKAWSSWRTPG